MLLNPCVPSFCVLSVVFQIRTIHILKQTRQTSARNSSWPGKLQCLTLFLPSHNVSPATSLRQAPFHGRLENLLRTAPDASSSKTIIIRFKFKSQEIAVKQIIRESQVTKTEGLPSNLIQWLPAVIFHIPQEGQDKLEDGPIFFVTCERLHVFQREAGRLRGLYCLENPK